MDAYTHAFGYYCVEERYLAERGWRLQCRGPHWDTYPPRCRNAVFPCPGGCGTALHSAADAGEKDRVQELLLAGADVNALDGEGRTALHVAAERGGDDGVVRALSSAGADATLRHGPLSLSALGESTSFGWLDIMRVLIEHGVDLNVACRDGLTALHISILTSNVCAVDMLVEAGADIEARDGCGLAPLHIAASRNGNNTDVLRCLLARGGADLDALNGRGRSALQLAVSIDDSPSTVDKVQALLDAGVSIDNRDHAGRSALDYAALAGNAGVLSAMIEHDVDVTAVAHTGGAASGFTALHYASAGGNPEVIDVLVEAGADIAATEDKGLNCLHFAAGIADANVMQAMLRHAGGADGLGRMDLESALLLATTGPGINEKPIAAVVDLLLRWGADERAVSNANRRLIGKNAPQDPATQKDAERVRELLRSAPKDRAWRRRGFLVVCRAFPGKVRLKPGSGPPLPSRRCSRPRLVATDDAGVSEWAGVVGRLLWLDDGVFRTVLEYV